MIRALGRNHLNTFEQKEIIVHLETILLSFVSYLGFTNTKKVCMVEVSLSDKGRAVKLCIKL